MIRENMNNPFNKEIGFHNKEIAFHTNDYKQAFEIFIYIFKLKKSRKYINLLDIIFDTLQIDLKMDYCEKETGILQDSFLTFYFEKEATQEFKEFILEGYNSWFEEQDKQRMEKEEEKLIFQSKSYKQIEIFIRYVFEFDNFLKMLFSLDEFVKHLVEKKLIKTKVYEKNLMPWVIEYGENATIGMREFIKFKSNEFQKRD